MQTTSSLIIVRLIKDSSSRSIFMNGNALAQKIIGKVISIKNLNPCGLVLVFILGNGILVLYKKEIEN